MLTKEGVLYKSKYQLGRVRSNIQVKNQKLIRECMDELQIEGYSSPFRRGCQGEEESESVEPVK